MIPQILGALGGAYGAYASTPEGEDPDLMGILTGAGTGAVNPVAGISSGVVAGVGELTDNSDNATKENSTENTAVGNVSNAITSSKPQYAGNGNGENNSLNPAFGKPSINQQTQNAVKTQMSSDAQAKTMLNIA